MELSTESWIGRKVRRTDTDDDDVLGHAIVLAVDDTDWAPSAWIKYPGRDEGGKRDYPSYRSVDLSDLEDIKTGECGPRWGDNAFQDEYAPPPAAEG